MISKKADDELITTVVNFKKFWKNFLKLTRKILVQKWNVYKNINFWNLNNLQWFSSML